MKRAIKIKKIADYLKQDWYILLMILAGFALGAYFYPKLPARVPTHWNNSGHVDGYSSRFSGAFMLSFTYLGIYALLIIVPVIDPRAKNYDKFKGSFQMIKCLLLTLFLIIQTCALLVATGVHININLISGIAVSIMLIIMGNVMGRIRPNYFVGVRTPWALANEDVWRKTHRITGPIWVLGGIANLILTILGNRFEVVGFILILVVIVAFPYVYSYLIFRKMNRGK
jgi:uncharacterized membrane protein